MLNFDLQLKANSSLEDTVNETSEATSSTRISWIGDISSEHDGSVSQSVDVIQVYADVYFD